MLSFKSSLLVKTFHNRSPGRAKSFKQLWSPRQPNFRHRCAKPSKLTSHRSFSYSPSQLPSNHFLRHGILFLGAVSAGMLGYYYSDQNGEKKSIFDFSSLFEVQAASIRSLSLEEQNTLARLVELADSGDADAQYDYAVVLHRGELVPRDIKRSVEYFQKASDGGVKEAAYNLGIMYLSGNAVPKDTKKAIKYLERSAELNCSEALNKLGSMYLNGNDLPVNSSKAYQYYLRSANNENDLGMFMTALLLHTGRGTVQNDHEALKWFQKAGAHGNAYACYHTAMMFHRGIGTPSNINYALEWYDVASELGDADAKAILGLFYLYGYKTTTTTVEKDVKKGLKLLKDASAKSTIAQRTLAALYLQRGEIEIPSSLLASLTPSFSSNGNQENDDDAEIPLPIPQSYEKAYKLFVECAKMNDNDCRSELATMIVNGKGVDQKHNDLTLAFKLVQKAASEGHIPSIVKQGVMHALGIGTEADPKAAVDMWTKAADLNDAEALYHLGMAHFHGNGVPKNWTTAKALFIRADGAGSRPAWEATVYMKNIERTELPVYKDELINSLNKPAKPYKL